MPVRQDYILRMIEQLGAVLRRLRERLARGVPLPELVEEARESQATLLGPLWPTLQQLDARTAAALVPDTRQLRLWAELMQVEAEGHRLLGDEARADHLGRRAAALALAADARGD